MSNSFYQKVFNLIDHQDFLTADSVKNEFALIEAAFDKFPTLASNGGKLVKIKADVTGLEAVSASVAASSLATNGYYVLPTSPNNLILQWGTGTSNATGDVSITLPTTFPNAILHAIAGSSDSGTWATNEMFAWGVDFAACTTSTLAIDVRKIAGTAAPTNVASGKVCRYIAWGY